MNRVCVIVFVLLMIFGVSLALLSSPEKVQALPEYSSQTGEPCASCHLSPSGGGPRGPRGQAWVGSGKPGAVPSTVDSLELLGVKLEVDPAQFEAVSEPIPAAQPLQLPEKSIQTIHDWLKDFQGN